LADSWTERFPHSQSTWIQSLCNQVRAGATWNFPTTTWDIMQGFNDSIWRAPVLTRVRKIPSRQCTQFDVYFFKFDVNAEGDLININIPTSTKRKKKSKVKEKSHGEKKRGGKKKLSKSKKPGKPGKTKLKSGRKKKS
jgi:hypothetical protein